MSELLSSYRVRRRILRIAVLLLAAGSIAGLLTLVDWDTGFKIDRDTFSNEPAQVVREERKAPFTPRRRRQIQAVLDEFVPAAVARRDVTASYKLVTPALRQGATRRKWTTGDIPIYPYPAAGRPAISQVVGSYENSVLLDVRLRPKPGANVGLGAFDVDLKAVGRGERRRWLVDSFVPRVIYPPARERSAARGRERPEPAREQAPVQASEQPRLSARWFVLPLLLLSPIALVPLVLALRGWQRGRSAH